MRFAVAATVIFSLLLISKPVKGQVSGADSLKKLSTDTLHGADSVNVKEEEGEGIDEKVNYSASDSAVTFPGQQRAILYGKARVEYGSMNIQAGRIEVDYGKNLIIAYGQTDSTGKLTDTPVFKERSETMEAEKIIYNLKSRKGKIYNAMTKQGELLVVGNEIKKDSDNVIYMKNMKCIPCQQSDARTVFRSTRAKIIPNDKIITGPMFVEVGGVPTPLGLPFGYFPNTKGQHTGLLLPTYGSSIPFGYFLKDGGYYFPINSKTDMIIRGDIYGNGSWAINTTNNYKVLYKSAGSLYLKYSTFNNGDPDDPTNFSKQRAYEVRWLHAQDNKSNPSVLFSSNVNYVNNQQFNRFNAPTSNQFLQNTFQSRINFTKTFRRSSVSVNASHSQNTQTKQTEISFPDLTWNVTRFFPFRRGSGGKQNVLDKIGIAYQMVAKNTLRGKDSSGSLFKGNIADSLRYGIQHSLPVSTNFNLFKYITVTPGMNLSAVMIPTQVKKQFYVSDRLVHSTQVQNFTTGYDWNFNTSFSTKLFFDYIFPRSSVRQIRHLLIPTIGYTYRPDFSESQYGFYKTVHDSLNRTIRYSVFEKSIYGGPSAGKQSAVSINLSNNVEGKIKQRSDSGVSFKKVVIIQNISLNTNYNFAADSFKMAPIQLTGRTVLLKYFDITASSSYNPYVYIKDQHRYTDKFSIAHNGGLARFTSGNMAVGTSIGSNMLAALRNARQPPTMTNAAENGVDTKAGEAMQWNLRINYNLTLAPGETGRILPTQNLQMSGDVNPTKFWKIGLSTAYDFINQNLGYTSLNIYRDLKCWEAKISWVPFGVRKSYTLGINLKTSIFREIKVPIPGVKPTAQQ
jgi:hypothetical protein